jgi:hypothetical protein
LDQTDDQEGKDCHRHSHDVLQRIKIDVYQVFCNLLFLLENKLQCSKRWICLIVASFCFENGFFLLPICVCLWMGM